VHVADSFSLKECLHVCGFPRKLRPRLNRARIHSRRVWVQTLEKIPQDSFTTCVGADPGEDSRFPPGEPSHQAQGQQDQGQESPQGALRLGQGSDDDDLRR